MIEVESVGGTVQFDGKIVTIRRAGSRLARSVFGSVEHTIPVTQIASVQWQAASWRAAGHIRFVVPGSQASTERTAPGRDENAILFGRGDQPAFEKLRDLVQDALSR